VNACQFGLVFSVVHLFHLFAGLHHAMRMCCCT
jgi:hypothetical protein